MLPRCREGCVLETGDGEESLQLQMGVEPKIGGTPPKWMVKIMENPIKIDDLGGFPYFWKHPYSCKSFWMIQRNMGKLS